MYVCVCVWASSELERQMPVYLGSRDVKNQPRAQGRPIQQQGTCAATHPTTRQQTYRQLSRKLWESDYFLWMMICWTLAALPPPPPTRLDAGERRLTARVGGASTGVDSELRGSLCVRVCSAADLG